MLIDLADAAAVASASDAGGKARGLARLIAAGLPVPPGVVLTGAVFTATVGAVTSSLAEAGARFAALAEAAAQARPPTALAEAVTAHARRLGPRLAVRSSMAMEDGATRAAPGLGTTVLDVEPDAVWSAIRAVWSAAMTPAVLAYARDRDADLAAPAVVVQAFVEGARATIYTRAPGRPDDDEAWISTGAGAPTKIARGVASPTRADAAWRSSPLGLALAAEAAIGADAGADVELVQHADGWVVVQARPLVHPPPRPRRRPVPSMLLAPLREPVRAWRRDVTHNPQPLSVAQAELCARVEAAAVAPFHLAVVASQLYWAPRADRPAPPVVTSGPELARRIAAAEAAVAAIVAARAPDATVDGAIERYLAGYRILASELGPLIAAGRAVLPAALAARGLAPSLAASLTPRRPSSIAAQLAAAARGALSRDELLDAIGDAASAWDVAAPSFAESPRLLDDAVVRAAARPVAPPAPPAPAGLDEAVAIARIAADASERDDLWYWRAQAVVRRAILAAAARGRLVGDDGFWIPLAELETIGPVAARGRAAGARRAAERGAAWLWPLTLDAPPAGVDATRWQGSGVGGIVSGPVHHVEGGAVPRGAIALARAVTPALAISLDGAAAIVSEHGTLLDHGAAMARELGIPCVVGCPGICDALVDATWITLDGDQGTVTVV